MTKFTRKLTVPTADTFDIASAPWISDLLRHWKPAGHPVPMADWTLNGSSKKLAGKRPMGLRLAIRKGYVNFYCGGQSIAKVGMGQSLTGRTHAKYLFDDTPGGQTYTKLGVNDADVTSWMVRSHGYHGVEKLFVEDVCAANGTVIDLEMGLPSLEVRNPVTGIAKKVAPRIDLVALEKLMDGWQVVFWEAKLPSDDRMRSKSDTPEVIAQMKNYTEWFAQEGTRDDVLKAYRDTCILLVAIHKLATDLNISVEPLHQAIIDIATTPSLLKQIDPMVRLLIDMRQGDAHFDEMHLPKLVDVPMHCVRTEADLTLPDRAQST